MMASVHYAIINHVKCSQTKSVFLKIAAIAVILRNTFKVPTTKVARWFILMPILVHFVAPFFQNKFYFHFLICTIQ
jgi:hypothetical protein